MTSELFVVDASVALKWLVAEPGTTDALALRRHRLLAPDLFWPECTNVLWRKVRTGEMPVEAALLAVEALATAPVEAVPTGPLAPAALTLAMALDHPAYDCFYLALAEALARPLVTADRRLLERSGRRPDLAGLVLPLEGLAARLGS